MYFQFASYLPTHNDFHAAVRLLILVAFEVESLWQKHYRHLAEFSSYYRFINRCDMMILPGQSWQSVFDRDSELKCCLLVFHYYLQNKLIVHLLPVVTKISLPSKHFLAEWLVVFAKCVFSDINLPNLHEFQEPEFKITV